MKKDDTWRVFKLINLQNQLVPQMQIEILFKAME